MAHKELTKEEEDKHSELIKAAEEVVRVVVADSFD